VCAGVNSRDKRAEDEGRRRQVGGHTTEEGSLRMETKVLQLSTQSRRSVSSYITCLNLVIDNEVKIESVVTRPNSTQVYL